MERQKRRHWHQRALNKLIEAKKRQSEEKIGGWVDGWMGGWIDRCMDGWMDGCMG